MPLLCVLTLYFQKLVLLSLMFYTSLSGAPVLHVAADLQLTSHKKFGWRPESYGATHSENCIYCAEKVAYGLDFCKKLLCQLKNPDEINTRHVYLKKPQINSV